MSIAATVIVAGLLFFAKRLLADELVGRVNHVARGILSLTALLVPSSQRKSVLQKWHESLDSDMERFDGLPLTKLVRAAWQFTSRLATIPQLRRETRMDRRNSPAGMLMGQALLIGFYPPVAVTMGMPSPVTSEIAGKIWGATAVASLMLLVTSRPRRSSRFESARPDGRDPLSPRTLRAQFAVYGARIAAPLIALTFGSLWVSLNPDNMHIAWVSGTWLILAALTARHMKHHAELEWLAGVTLMRRDHERRAKWSTRSRTMLDGVQRVEPVHAWLPILGATVYVLAACAPAIAVVMVAHAGALPHSVRLLLLSVALGPLTAIALSAAVMFGRPALHLIDPSSNFLRATACSLAGIVWGLSLLVVLISVAPDSWLWPFASYLTITAATIITVTKINLIAAHQGKPGVLTPIAAQWILADQRYTSQC